MATKLLLNLERRATQGKRVRYLRREGMVPANVYGRGQESVAVQALLRDFRRVFREAGANAIVNVAIEGEATPRPVLLRNVQRHPVTDEILHIDLYQVDLQRPVHAPVHLTFVGVSEAVHLGGVLVHTLDAVQVEALPDAVPSHFEVDLARLVSFGDAVHVSDLAPPSGVRILTDPATVIASVSAPRLVAEEEEVAAEVAAPAVIGEEKKEEAEEAAE